VRGSARASRNIAGTTRPFGRRASLDGGIVARIRRRLGAFFTGPMLLLSGTVVVLTLIAALFASGWVGRSVHAVNHAVDTVVADAGFGIAEIHISGNQHTPYRQVLAVLGMQPGQSIFSADLAGARARLAHLPWVASVSVHRRYPNAIFVTMEEKRPFALWQTPPDASGQRHIAVVERGGGVITTKGVEKYRHLPKLLGVGAPAHAGDIVDEVQAHRAVAARVAAYDYQSGRRWNLILNDGVIVKLPEKGWRAQIAVLGRLIVDDAILERAISEIDLRSPTQFFFVLKNGESQGRLRGKET
jgi:cell division protein FtsQ